MTSKKENEIKISDKDEVIAKSRSEFPEELLAFIDECLKSEHPKSHLIAILHKVQTHFGYLSEEKMEAVAQIMRIPAAKISGVATFYHYFRIKAVGKIIISVCLGTACYVKGAGRVINRFEEELGIKVGETSKDNQFTLLEARCLGMCAMAPVVQIGSDIHAKVTPDQVPALLEKYIKK